MGQAEVVTKKPADLVEAVTAALLPLAEPERAAAMAAYMQHHFPFLGIQMPQRRKTLQPLLRAYAGDPLTAADIIWHRREREYQYVACDLLALQAKHLATDALEPLLALAQRKSWWDTVDSLVKVVGGLVQRQPALAARMDELIVHEDFWLRRIALLHQLGWKEQTDADRLFRYCLQQAGEKEFFIRKAIGWALRDYAHHAPEAVQRFLDHNGAALSPLSRREAGKHLEAA